MTAKDRRESDEVMNLVIDRLNVIEKKLDDFIDKTNEAIKDLCVGYTKNEQKISSLSGWIFKFVVPAICLVCGGGAYFIIDLILRHVTGGK